MMENWIHKMTRKLFGGTLFFFFKKKSINQSPIVEGQCAWSRKVAAMVLTSAARAGWTNDAAVTVAKVVDLLAKTKKRSVTRLQLLLCELKFGTPWAARAAPGLDTPNIPVHIESALIIILWKWLVCTSNT